MMKRNAVIAAGNVLAGEPALHAALGGLAGDQAEEQIVRDAATAVLARLTGSRPRTGSESTRNPGH